MSGDGAFGFIDPKDVLRGCHIIPNFAKGKQQADGVGILTVPRMLEIIINTMLASKFNYF